MSWRSSWGQAWKSGTGWNVSSPSHHPPPPHHPESEWHWSGSWLCCPTCRLPFHSPDSPELRSEPDYQSLRRKFRKQTTLMFNMHRIKRSDGQSGSWRECFCRLKSIRLLWLLHSEPPTQEMKADTQPRAWNCQITVSNPGLVTSLQQLNLPCPHLSLSLPHLAPTRLISASLKSEKAQERNDDTNK